MRCPTRASFALPLAAALVPLSVLAEDGPYCRRVRAEAQVQAALLMSPQLVVQALHVPNGIAIGAEPVTSGFAAYQARAGVAFSPLDLAKGLALTRASDDDCEQFTAQTSLEDFVENGEGAARLPALRRQVAFLEASRPTWKALVEREEARFDSHAITLLELNQVRARGAALERRLVQAQGEAERLAARPYQPPAAPTGALVQRWLEHTMELERQRSTVRKLSFWNLRLTAGAVASEQPVDWYGLAELTVHVGAIVDGRSERLALEARDQELRQERTSVEVRVREAERNLSLLRAQARRELTLVEAQLASAAATRDVVERADAPAAAFALALVTCDQLEAEAERTYLASFVEQLSALLPENAHE